MFLISLWKIKCSSYKKIDAIELVIYSTYFLEFMEKNLVVDWNIISILLGTVLRITIKIHGLSPWLEFHCHSNVYVTVHDTVL